MENPSICKLCHEQDRGCCFLKPQTSEYMFGLTNFEISIIVKHKNITESDFITQDYVKASFQQLLCEMDDNFKSMFPMNIRKKLRIVEEKCVFLSKNGCKLEEHIRPFYCRIYPFWRNKRGLFVLQSELCLAQKSNSIYEMMEKLDTSEHQIVDLYDQWVEKVRMHYKEQLGVVFP